MHAANATNDNLGSKELIFILMFGGYGGCSTNKKDYKTKNQTKQKNSLFSVLHTCPEGVVLSIP